MILILYLVFFLPAAMSDLNKKQQEACEAVAEGKNILLTGPAGTGKSYAIKHIIEGLKENNKKYAMTATTGTAAVLIGGQTLHSFLGIGLGKGELIDNIKRIRKNPNTYKTLAELDVLIIDEVSMLDAELFDKIAEILSTIKAGTLKIPELRLVPFGGIQVILIGDFCQLAPVQGNHCFLSKSWDALEIKVVMLEEIIRQGQDILFQKMLQIIRKGKCTDNIIKVLERLKDTEFPDDIKPTKLYPVNVDVERINKQEIAKLKAEGNEFKTYKAKASSDNIKNAASFDIELTMGSQIIIIRNIDVATGLVNGKRGVITHLGDDYIIIKDVANEAFKIEYFKDSDEKSFDPVKKCCTAFICHMPVRTCYALSIHKSQGMTIDALELDLGKNIFAAGQAYTALTRAKTLQSIKIINVDKDSFKINGYVKKFYAGIVET
jgi:ATP-dependent DNA helicase PIF1